MSSSTERQERLARQLRENLKKRKSTVRKRVVVEEADRKIGADEVEEPKNNGELDETP